MWSKPERYILFVIAFLLGCQPQKQVIKTHPVSSRVVAGSKMRLSTELFKQNNKITSQNSDFRYSAKLGKIEKDIYYAPDNAGEEIITIEHIAAKVKSQVRFNVLSAPKLTVNLNRTKLNTSESIYLQPLIKIAQEDQKIDYDKFQYKAKRGSFKGNQYQAPDQAGKDSLEIYYAPMDLTFTQEVQITTQAILIADHPNHVAIQSKTPIRFFMQEKGVKSPVASPEIVVTPQLGKWSDNIYHAPKNSGMENITVMHKPSGQQINIKMEIKALKVIFTLAQNTLTYEETLRITPQVKQGKKIIQAKAGDFRYSAAKGSFSENTYIAPSKEGKDTITVEYVPLKLKSSQEIEIKYTPYRTLRTERFTMLIPTGWHIEQNDIGFSAQGKEGSKYEGCSVMSTVLPGFDFLDIATMRLFFQQQIDEYNKDIEETSEEEIHIAGSTALRVTFENYTGLAEKSWLILLKKQGASYILALRGNRKFFDEEKVPQHIIDNFKFKELKMSDKENYSIKDSLKETDHDAFTISIPQEWKVHEISGGFLAGVSKSNEGMAAVSSVHQNGRSLIVFILAHRQQEIRNFDLSLLLVLLRQMIKDSSITKEKEEQDMELKHGKAKLLEIEGGEDITQRTWLIATKHEATAFGILVRGPVNIWDANPGLAEKIIKTFAPK